MRHGEVSSKDVAKAVVGKSAKDREKIFTKILQGHPEHAPTGCGTEAHDFIRKVRDSVRGEEAVRVCIQEEIDRAVVPPKVVLF
jgi:hypothetical protein